MEKGTVRAIVAVGVLGIGAILGGIKRHSEQSKPINYSPEECARRIERAEKIELREIPFSFTTTYNLMADGERVGTVYEEAFTWGTKFDFYAGTHKQGKYLGRAEEKVFSIGHQSTIYDERNRVIGKLDEKLLKLNPGRLIEVYNGSGEKVAISDEEVLHLTKTTKIYSADKKQVIGGSKKDAYWDNYTITNHNTEIDNRLFIGLVAMEDKLDDQESQSDDDSSSDSD